MLHEVYYYLVGCLVDLCDARNAEPPILIFSCVNAAWMNGLEVCAIEADTSRACLILSVGIATRYVYATYMKTPVTTAEAEAWEAAKKACGGLHFLAIQDDLDSDDCVGFWLLLDLPPPPV
ncbi:hypothetical protein OIU85_014700 [Salix viminalis]|uniref:RNA-binding protein Tab2/Atab2 C-terminal domain-containing protein n=1 Tax=Salix viminalis TaxID=40686 RepID=A0A9Q0NJJ2_SALVM|nr:hypothetical protein OIU85_014700 [Salix viminalis]